MGESDPKSVKKKKVVKTPFIMAERIKNHLKNQALKTSRSEKWDV